MSALPYDDLSFRQGSYDKHTILIGVDITGTAFRFIVADPTDANSLLIDKDMVNEEPQSAGLTSVQIDPTDLAGLTPGRNYPYNVVSSGPIVVATGRVYVLPVWAGG